MQIYTRRNRQYAERLDVFRRSLRQHVLTASVFRNFRYVLIQTRGKGFGFTGFTGFVYFEGDTRQDTPRPIHTIFFGKRPLLRAAAAAAAASMLEHEIFSNNTHTYSHLLRNIFSIQTVHNGLQCKNRVRRYTCKTRDRKRKRTIFRILFKRVDRFSIYIQLY